MKSKPNKIKDKARVLRKKGLSLGEISKKLKLSKSTLGAWLKNVKLNKIQKQNLLKKQIKFLISKPNPKKKLRKS